MAIIELHLDRPALKRVEATPEERRTIETGSNPESTDESTEQSGGSLGRKLLLVAMVGAVAFAAMRLRRSESDEEAAIDIGTEETRPETK